MNNKKAQSSMSVSKLGQSILNSTKLLFKNKDFESVAFIVITLLILAMTTMSLFS